MATGPVGPVIGEVVQGGVENPACPGCAGCVQAYGAERVLKAPWPDAHADHFRGNPSPEEREHLPAFPPEVGGAALHQPPPGSNSPSGHSGFDLVLGYVRQRSFHDDMGRVGAFRGQSRKLERDPCDTAGTLRSGSKPLKSRFDSARPVGDENLPARAGPIPPVG